jgi:hypothetical protein
MRFRDLDTESSLTTENKNFADLLFLRKKRDIRFDNSKSVLKNSETTGLDWIEWKIVFSFCSGMSVVCKETMNASKEDDNRHVAEQRLSHVISFNNGCFPLRK